MTSQQPTGKRDPAAHPLDTRSSAQKLLELPVRRTWVGFKMAVCLHWSEVIGGMATVALLAWGSPSCQQVKRVSGSAQTGPIPSERTLFSSSVCCLWTCSGPVPSSPCPTGSAPGRPLASHQAWETASRKGTQSRSPGWASDAGQVHRRLQGNKPVRTGGKMGPEATPIAHVHLT